ncbi:sigma-70 family RNA polymerase sigma factor [Sinomicrobium soli]|uniref:sigma-70 family RNA polymerase sigma factor n=1 Tax=Sinomicrobium sp. N-1-3-6 TaxID=2219864 RepID=UPI001375350D|nr:sigma-70 family RNA polymerase sigma factor [Sinomicrobium sp. N-1-3-6]
MSNRESDVMTGTGLKGQERRALENFIDRNYAKIYRFILFKVRDGELADDIFQDTIFRVIQAFKKGNYKEEGRFDAWSIQIAKNLIVDHVRKEERMKVVDHYDIAETALGLADDHDSEIDRKLVAEHKKNLVNSLVKELPQEQRDVLVMRIYEGMSFKEISTAQCISINTALGRMRYALINLKKLVREKGIVAINL